MARKTLPTLVPTPPEQLELFEIEERIKALHEAGVAAVGEAAASLRVVAGHAMETGRLLLAAKAKVKAEGLGWIEWVESKLPFGRHQAAKYIRVARADGDRGLHSDTGSRSLRASLRELIAPADDEAKPRPRADDDEFNASGTIAKITHVIVTALNDWPDEENAKLADLTKRMQSLIAKIEKRRLGE